MRAMWKGTIGLGSFGIPVRAYSAIEERGVALHQVHEPDGGRIRLKRVCEVDGAEVDADATAKGFALPGGDVVVLSEADLASLPLPTASSIEISAFTPLDRIDPLYFARGYFLEPEVAATRPYVLLSEAMQQSGTVAVVRVALRQRETLAVLRVRDQVIVLQTMLWPDEIRTPDFPFQHTETDVRANEVRTAVGFIEELAGDFEPARYTDRSRAALEALIEAKAEGNEVVQPTAAEQDAGVDALLAALRETAEEPAVLRAKAAARKAAAAKAAATRAARRAETAARATE
ncbi:non-homologous end joining protein Ku [Amycolatopsis sp. CA-230715]|uniref:non-homologous end joining protein Ku n=1 Tax=Amycolatopsis sp. CA-230715 TaxID=2745196 RepID=UPI001C01ED0B|nr:Ku protein [Amycolatopsis sp. CA-230715]QWF82933.1 Non-homologous end joining protein Ku [Amycolatopsis sp. CA-230715]